MRHHTQPSSLLPLLALTAVAAIGAPSLGDDVPRNWRAELPTIDHDMLAELVGFAPPPFASDLVWVSDEPLTWTALRGRVVVVQSWSVASSRGRAAATATMDALTELDPDGFVVVALHTPEDAGKAETFLERRPLETPIAVDHSGVFCDALGLYKRPANVVVDRSGVVRFAALNPAGLRRAVEQLMAEPYDPAATPAERDAEPEPRVVEYPPISGSVGKAKDLRGRSAPDFHVAQWMTNEPDAKGKVVLLDFWATWCRPCVASIPHLNGFADRFGDDLVIVGISDESQSKFEQGLQRQNLRAASFHYALALDPRARMKSAIGIRAIPHAIVMSDDWIVRWQGHPATLRESVLEQIIEANGGATRQDTRRNRWQAGTSGR